LSDVISINPADEPGSANETVADRLARYMRSGTLSLAALPPLSLYVHLPWCLKKCPYCDFNSHENKG
jgi:coproporphyrinogen III oxidase-like Fe-S oxidoreductase